MTITIMMAVIVLLLAGGALADLAADAAELRRAMTEEIARQEGWYFLDSPIRHLHNPNALVFAGQLGATRAPNGYAQFSKDEADRDLAAKFRVVDRAIELGLHYRGWDKIEKVLAMRAGTDTDVKLYVRLIVERLRERGIKP